MIYYLVTPSHAYTMGTFLMSWGTAFAPRIRPVSYTQVLQGESLPLPDTSWVFSDLDRLSAEQREQLGPMHDSLVQIRGASHVLNDPLRLKLRLAMLKTFHEQGINRFDAQRVSDDTTPARYPVFIRSEAGFEKAQPPLLTDATEYRDAVAALTRTGQSLADTLAVEYLDSADEHGIYRKYGAFVVGNRIVPRHLFFSRDWLVKLADLDDPDLLAEERAYIEDNPHEEALRAAAQLAGAGYGRIDYSVIDGQPQIWEINTNPMIASRISSIMPGRRETHLRFIEKFGEALQALEAGEV